MWLEGNEQGLRAHHGGGGREEAPGGHSKDPKCYSKHDGNSQRAESGKVI